MTKFAIIQRFHDLYLFMNTRNIIFFDDNDVRKNLLPITYTRPIAKIRLGITTIEEKWATMLGVATILISPPHI